jgi:uncharacterized cupin superfamily protein
LEANIDHVKPGGSTNGFIEHQGEEMGFVLEGELELTIEGKTVRAQQGDRLFLSRLPHGNRNSGKTLMRILWVNTPKVDFNRFPYARRVLARFER